MWYIAGMSALLAVMFSAITHSPEPGPVGRALPVVFLVGSILAAAAAFVLGRLPPTHPIRRSRSLWAVLFAGAMTATVPAALIG